MKHPQRWKKTPIEEHKIIADTDAIKEEIVIKQRTNK